jgi:ribose 1,5-bisphosphokinase
MHWQSHGFYYGIGIEVDIWLSKGCRVVVNGSRAYLPQAMDRYPQLNVILIDVSEAELERRLQIRGRESAEKIQSRLAHNRQLATESLVNVPNMTIIHNDGPIEKAGELLARQLIR